MSIAQHIIERAAAGLDPRAQRSVGIHATTTALQTAAPAASNPGAVALVGSAAPYAQYVSNGSAWSPVSGGSLTPPDPTGDVAVDFSTLKAFFDAAPTYATIKFVAGTTWNIHAGAIRYKHGQTIDHSGSVIRRANEVVTTTTAVVALTAGVVVLPVTSTAGFAIGQQIAVRGTKANGHVVIGWLTRCTEVAANSITVAAPYQPINVTAGGYEASADLLVGATVMTKGVMVDGRSGLTDVSETWTAIGIDIDGNAANNTTYNRWEYCQEVLQWGTSSTIRGLKIRNACGEGLVIFGENPKAQDVDMDTLGGNGIHFNDGANDPWIHRAVVRRANQYVGVGHEDGGIIASNGTYRAVIDGFLIEGCRLAGVGSFDQSDNSFALITHGYIKDCLGAGLDLFSPSTNRSAGLKVSEVEVSNCGTVLLGCDKSNASAQGLYCDDFDVRALTLVNTGAFISGLRSSTVDIRQRWDDSAVTTAANTAAGRATNYVIPTTGATLNGLVQIASCKSSKIKVVARDGSAAPTGYSLIYCYSSNGDALSDCDLDFTATGGRRPVATGGALSENRFSVKTRGHLSGYTGLDIGLARNSNLPADYQKPRGNIFAVDIEFSAAATNTFGVKANVPAAVADNGGWLRIGGKIRCLAASSGLSYGISSQTSGGSMVRLDDIEIIGPASNFWPIHTTACSDAAPCRVYNVKTYPAPQALATNWIAENAILTLPAV